MASVDSCHLKLTSLPGFPSGFLQPPLPVISLPCASRRPNLRGKRLSLSGQRPCWRTKREAATLAASPFYSGLLFDLSYSLQITAPKLAEILQKAGA
ncbi:MAG TPA: hypothetical protein VMT91_00035 [Anaerolineales bacterium]|nr:hypothetical protein [Anaerolineales bacterium]